MIWGNPLASLDMQCVSQGFLEERDWQNESDVSKGDKELETVVQLVQQWLFPCGKAENLVVIQSIGWMFQLVFDLQWSP